MSVDEQQVEDTDAALDESAEQRITQAVQGIAERRALIEQIKGILMFVYGIDADAAFAILRRQSQDDNLKLRFVAEQILKDLLELSQSKAPSRRLAADGLPITAHQRITHVAARQRDGQSTNHE